MVVVVAFFLGQRSKEIANRIVHVFRSDPSFPAAVLRTMENGSVVLTWKDAVPKVQNRHPSVASVSVIDSNRVRFTPELDGVAVLNVWHADGQTTQIEVTVADGDIASLSEFQSP